MDDYSVCRPFVPLRRYSVKDSGIRLNRYLFCDSRSCPNNQSCRNIQQGKTLRFRCPLQSAPVRTDGFFLPRNGCNIAPGTDPAMETVTEDFQNFSQRFSGADFCCRQTTASCTFVCRKFFRHTKVQLARLKWGEKSAAEKFSINLCQTSATASEGGSFPSAILQPCGRQNKPSVRTGAVWSGHRNRGISPSCILQHERSIFLLRSLSRYKLHEIENGILNGLTQ